MNFITSTLAVVSKDVRSELRTRYAMNALLNVCYYFGGNNFVCSSRR